MNKSVSIFFLILTFIFFIVISGYAQPWPPGPPDPPDPTVPIDGGLGFLLAAGVIYGIHRFRKSRKS
jgi:hypothetical protein